MKVAREDRYEFVVYDSARTINGVVGDCLQLTTDGGVPIYRRKVLVGAVKPSDWRQIVLRPRATSPSTIQPKGDQP